MSEAIEEALLDELNIYYDTLGAVSRFGRPVSNYIMWYGVLDDIINRIDDLGERITEAELDYEFDPESNRFTTDVEWQYNSFRRALPGNPSPIRAYRYACGEFPDREVHHLLQLRSYRLLWTLPSELIGGIIGYISGDIRAFRRDLALLAGSDHDDAFIDDYLAQGFEYNAAATMTAANHAKIDAHIMIYDALVATLPMPFA